MSNGAGNGHPFDCFCYECRGDFDTGPPAWSLCDSLVTCIACGAAHGLCHELTAERHGEQMIHRNNSNDSGGRGRGGRNSNLIPYLTADKLTVDPVTTKILGARVQPDNFNKKEEVVVVKIALKGNPYLWTLRSNNPNLDVLCEAFGDDETKWVGEEAMLYLETDAFDNKTWIRCDAEKLAPKKGK